MPNLEDLNKIVTATRILANPDSGYTPPVAIAIANVFATYAQGAFPETLDVHVLNLADAITHPLTIDA